MKFAIPILLASCAVLLGGASSASEAAPDLDTAVETLRSGLDSHPEHAVELFQDALRTNPENRGELLRAALDALRFEPGSLVPLIHTARLEFPEDDTLFAEAALATLPDQAGEIRSAFISSPEEMQHSTAASEPKGPSPESAELDEEIRDAIARVAAKAEGTHGPEQSPSHEHVRFRKPDEIRIPKRSRSADESSLVNHLPIDQTDERVMAAGNVKIDDAWKPSSDLHLDESRFAKRDGQATTAPLEAKIHERTTAGSVGLPKPPQLPHSGLHFISPASNTYESTIDLENGDPAPPGLVIRPDSTSPSRPK
ncbi:MAG TPA: hypothetical protein PLA50_14610 [Bacteroidia bacterium]|nr:hypothetical protein [Bacteroidia bacterium]